MYLLVICVCIYVIIIYDDVFIFYRFSKVVGEKLMDGNLNIIDFSDVNRLIKLIE